MSRSDAAWPNEPGCCLNGVDNDVDLSPAADCLVQQGFAFAGRYLGGPCYPGVPLSRREARVLSRAGLRILSIYSGANTVATFSCGLQTPIAGVVDGVAAALLARCVGQPCGSAIYLDLEAGQTHPPFVWLSYVQGWAQTVRLLGYRAGVYSPPDQLALIRSQPWGGCHILYWVVQSLGDAVIRPAPCPCAVLDYASLLQYVLCVTTCDSPEIDFDSAQDLDGMWALDCGEADAGGV